MPARVRRQFHSFFGAHTLWLAIERVYIFSMASGTVFVLICFSFTLPTSLNVLHWKRLNDRNTWCVCVSFFLFASACVRVCECVFEHSLYPYLKMQDIFCAYVLLFTMHRIETSKRAYGDHSPYAHTQPIALHSRTWHVTLRWTNFVCILSNRLNFWTNKKFRIPFEYACECMKIRLCGMKEEKKNESGINAFHASNIHSIERTWRFFSISSSSFSFSIFPLFGCLPVPVCMLYALSQPMHISRLTLTEMNRNRKEKKTNACVRFWKHKNEIDRTHHTHKIRT